METCEIVRGANVLLINVRTEDTKLISLPFTLASSRWPPKPGSAEDVQPTVPNCVNDMWSCKMCAYPRCVRAAGSVGKEGGRSWLNILRARNLSSERIAMALMRRTATGYISKLLSER